MPDDFPITSFAEMIAWEPFDHVIECINVSHLIPTLGVVEQSDAAISNCQINLIQSQLKKVYKN